MAHATPHRPAEAASALSAIGSLVLPGYPLEQLRRPARRALRLPLKRGFGLEGLRSGSSKLAQYAATHQLKMLEPALLTLTSDPTKTTQFWWSWELALPVLGDARADEDQGIGLTLIHGGFYVRVISTGGLGALPKLYAALLGEVLPMYRHELTHSTLYHRILGGLDGEDLDGLTLAVQVPIQLSIGEPPRLLRRPRQH
jgi:DNA gyrase inhibitor GyrI